MIPEKLLQVLKYEGVVAIATQSADGPHLVNSWNSYIKVTEDESLLIPAGGMNITEANIEKNSKVKVTFGSREVEGFHGPGTGFLISGTAVILKHGPEYDEVKQRFAWARAVLKIKVDSALQTL